MTISGWCASHGRPDQWHDECERRGLVCGCPNHALNKGFRAEVCENGGGPAGALTPVDPALDQHTSLEGSASRG